MLFSDLTASPTTDLIDPNLRDARGYSIETGYRGRCPITSSLMQAFFAAIQQPHRNHYKERTDGSTYQYRTNVANSRARGFESMIEFNPVKPGWRRPTGAVSASLLPIRTPMPVMEILALSRKEGNTLVESNLKNNRVENAPEHVFRGGFTYYFKGFSITPDQPYQSYVQRCQ